MAEQHTFRSDFKKFFGRGLAILLPSVLTLWILWQLIAFVYNNVGDPINRGIRLAVMQAMPLVVGDGVADRDGNAAGPDWWIVTNEQIDTYIESQQASGRIAAPGPDASHVTQRARARSMIQREAFAEWWKQHWFLEATGIIVAIILIYLSGVLLGNFLGRKAYARIERGLASLPGFKQLYPHVKQLVNLIMGDKPMAFNKAILIEYPRKGIWTLGLVTGESLPAIRQAAGGDVLSVFIPSTPTPFTGFTISVLKEDTIELPITIDHAIRFIITAGALAGSDKEKGALLPEQPPREQFERDARSGSVGRASTTPPPTDSPPSDSPPSDSQAGDGLERDGTR